MEIFTPLVGVSFRPTSAKEVVKHLTLSDGGDLELQPDPNNEYDSNAVKVIHKPSGEFIGFIARENNYEIFCALERGEELNVEIVGFENSIKPTLLITRDVASAYYDDEPAADESE
jgi:hypothetical protein